MLSTPPGAAFALDSAGRVKGNRRPRASFTDAVRRPLHVFQDA